MILLYYYYTITVIYHFYYVSDPETSGHANKDVVNEVNFRHAFENYKKYYNTNYRAPFHHNYDISTEM